MEQEILLKCWSRNPSCDKGTIGMFYRQRMLAIEGKYNNDDGLSIGIMCQVGTKSILGRRSRERL
jgi:hypothetical protein